MTLDPYRIALRDLTSLVAFHEETLPLIDRLREVHDTLFPDELFDDLLMWAINKLESDNPYKTMWDSLREYVSESITDDTAMALLTLDHDARLVAGLRRVDKFMNRLEKKHGT